MSERTVRAMAESAPQRAGTGIVGTESTGPAGAARVVSLLVVAVDGKRCGVPLDVVREVLPAARIEPLPGAPAAVMGTINLRGAPLAVLDAGRCLGGQDRPVRLDDRFVVVEVEAGPRAVRVDTADEIIDVAQHDIHSAASLAAGALRTAGIARLPDGLLVIVDPTRFLSPSEDAALSRLLEENDPRSR